METEVPDLVIHFPYEKPTTFYPIVTKSGLNLPNPLCCSYKVGPRLLKAAIDNKSGLSDPTLIIEDKSPGLLRVPKPGPSLPAAATTKVPFSYISFNLSRNGRSK